MDDDRKLWSFLLLMYECRSLIRSDFNQRKYDEHVVEIKRQIRTLNRNWRNNPKRVYLNGDYDGYLEKVEVPAELQSEEDREQWFYEDEQLVVAPSAYDCTGQKFTCWHRFKMLHGKWYLYHRVGVDV